MGYEWEWEWCFLTKMSLCGFCEIYKKWYIYCLETDTSFIKHVLTCLFNYFVYMIQSIIPDKTYLKQNKNEIEITSLFCIIIVSKYHSLMLVYILLAPFYFDILLNIIWICLFLHTSNGNSSRFLRWWLMIANPQTSSLPPTLRCKEIRYAIKLFLLEFLNNTLNFSVSYNVDNCTFIVGVTTTFVSSSLIKPW